MLERYRAVIWDWNGTLLDDAWLAHELGNDQLEAYGLAPISLEHYREVFCFPIKEFYRTLGFDFGRKPFEELSEEFHSEYAKRRVECQLQVGAEAVLSRGTEARKRQFVLSAAESSILQSSLEHFGLSQCFEHVRGLDNTHAHSKVELGHELVVHAGLSPGDTVLVGDTLHDFEVASALGVNCILVSRGYQSEQMLRRTGAKVIGSLKDLVPG